MPKTQTVENPENTETNTDNLSSEKSKESYTLENSSAPITQAEVIINSSSTAAADYPNDILDKIQTNTACPLKEAKEYSLKDALSYPQPVKLSSESVAIHSDAISVNLNALKDDKYSPLIPKDWIDANIEVKVLNGYPKTQNTLLHLFEEQNLTSFKEFASNSNDISESYKNYLLAEAEMRSQNYKEAYSYYSKANENPETGLSGLLKFRSAEALYNLKEYPDALIAFKSIVSGSKIFNLEKDFSISQCLIKLNRPKEALPILENIIKEQDTYHIGSKINYSVGLILYHQKRYSEALSFFEKSDIPSALYYQAKCFEEDKQYVPSASLYKKLYDTYPKNILSADALFGSGVIFYKMKQFENASGIFIDVITKYPKSHIAPFARFMLGACRYEMGLYGTAILNSDYFYKNYGNSPPSRYMLYIRAKSSEKLKRYSDAYKIYKSIIEENPDDEISEKAVCELSLLYYRTSKYGESYKYCSLYETKFSSPPFAEDIAFLKAMNLFRLNKTEESLKQFYGIVNTSFSKEVCGKSLFMIGSIYYKQKDYTPLTAGYFDLTENLKSSFTGEWISYAYLFTGYAYYNLSLYGQAKNIFNFITSNFSDSPAAMYAKSAIVSIDVMQGDFKSAEESNRELLYSYGDTSEIKENSSLLSAGLNFSKGEYSKAAGLFEEFTSNFPSSAEYFNALFMESECYYKLSDYKKAINIWKKLAAKRPPEGRRYSSYNAVILKTYGRIAYTYFGLEDFDNAIIYYRILIKKFPNSGTAKDAQIHIAQSYYNKKHFKSAISEYKGFLEKYPDYKRKNSILENIKFAYYKKALNNTSSNTDLLEFIAIYPESPLTGEIYWQLGTKAFEAKEYFKASEHFKRVISEYPNIESAKLALYYLAESYYFAKEYRDAVTAFNNFINSYPDDSLIGISEFHTANSYYKLGLYEDSVKHYESSKSSQEEDLRANAYLNKALVLKKLKKWDDAINEYRSFISAFTESDKINYAAYQIALTLKNTGDFINTAQTFESVKPSEDIEASELYYNTAEAFEKAGMNDKAKEYYILTTNLDKYSKRFFMASLVKLAEIYNLENNSAKAIETYNLIINNTDNPQWKIAAKAKISELKQNNAKEAN